MPQGIGWIDGLGKWLPSLNNLKRIMKLFSFLLGILFCIFILFIFQLGANSGKQIAVDSTKSKGYFETYGKKYQALEIETPNV